MNEPNASTPSRDTTISNSNVIRYLHTDTLIFYAPTTPDEHHESNKKTLLELQLAEAEPVVEWLTTVLWPGIKIEYNNGPLCHVRHRACGCTPGVSHDLRGRFLAVHFVT